VGVEELEGGGTERAGNYIFFCQKGNKNLHLQTGFLFTIELYQHAKLRVGICY
jgi:hypothetical protein